MIAETLPEYLWFTEDVFVEKGSAARMDSPIRNAAEREKLWAPGMGGGEIDCLATDYALRAPAEKNLNNPADTWGRSRGSSVWRRRCRRCSRW